MLCKRGLSSHEVSVRPSARMSRSYVQNSETLTVTDLSTSSSWYTGSHFSRLLLTTLLRLNGHAIMTANAIMTASHPELSECNKRHAKTDKYKKYSGM